MEKDANVTDSYESMAYQVYKFQNTTPPRFRTMKQTNEPNVKTEPDEVEKSAPKLTCPKTPNLSTRSRARPVAEDVLSREQQEEKDAEAMKKWVFGGAGGTVVVHVSLTTVTRVRFWLRAVFLRVLRFAPVVTLDQWGGGL